MAVTAMDKGAVVEGKTIVNGERITVLETTMQHVVDELKHTNCLLEGVFGFDGMCPKEREENEAFRETTRLHIHWLWGAISFLTGTGVTVAIAMLAKKG